MIGLLRYIQCHALLVLAKIPFCVGWKGPQGTTRRIALVPSTVVLRYQRMEKCLHETTIREEKKGLLYDTTAMHFEDNLCQIQIILFEGFFLASTDMSETMPTFLVLRYV